MRAYHIAVRSVKRMTGNTSWWMFTRPNWKWDGEIETESIWHACLHVSIWYKTPESTLIPGSISIIMVNKDIDTSMAAEGPTMAETSYLSLVQAQASITDAKESILFNNFFDLPPVLRLVSCCGPLAHLNFVKKSLTASLSIRCSRGTMYCFRVGSTKME
jgi:hypothetical protein